jgi:hypothetical protein
MGSQETGQTIWPPMSETRDRLLQQTLSSTLLWPDSEGFFQSLMSGDGMNWDHTFITQPETVHGNVDPVGPQQVASTPRGDELAVVEDGQRAVQTTYSLVTNTVSTPFVGVRIHG